MSGRRCAGKLRTSPARQHKRRRHVPAHLRVRAYLARDLPRSALDAVFAAQVLGRR